MVPILLIKQVNLIIKYLNTDQNSSLLLRTPAHSLHFPSGAIFLKNMLVIVVQGRHFVFHGVDLVEEEGEKDEVMVEVL